MKLHLPVSLFRAVMTLLSYTVGVVATTQILYGAAPDDAVEVVLINPEDLSRSEHTVNDREFLVKADLIFDGVNSPYMGPDAESWFFSGSPEISINFINATDQVFDVAESMTLEFETFEEISFKNEGQTVDTNPGGAIYGEENSSITLSKIGTITFSGNRAKFFWRYDDYYSYAEAYGGAISGTTVILSDNGSIEFSKNTATASHQYSDYECAYGGAISGTTVILSDNGSIEFNENTATSSDLDGEYDYAYGGAIYGKTIRMSGNGSVIFNGNKARSFPNYRYDETYGGAIHGTTIELSDNESLLFSYNTAISYGASHGGAISGTAITISGNGMVEFYSNEASTSAHGMYYSASSYGGAIYGSTVTLRGNDNVVFRMNRATTSNDQYAVDLRGGAIHGGIITLNDNGSVIFSENTTSVFNYGNRYGGAIYGGNNSSIMLSNNGNVEFSGNNVNAIDVNGSYSAYGGAIYGADDSSITLNHNESVTFSSNTATDGGGAIYGGNGSTITLNHNGSVTFNENASCAIVGTTVTLSNNGNVSFNGNSAFSYFAANGGAIAGKDITLSNNGSVTFSENSAKFDGGAIEGTTVTLNDNISVSFNGNSLSATGLDSKCTGGAISGDENSTITLNNNSIVSFSGNSVRGTGEYAESYGGAIYGGVGSSLTLSNNSSVTFNGNSVNDDGGAIYGAGSIEISNNGSVTFSENSASGDGGAIYGSSLYSSIAISNNGSVTFSGNSASNGGAIYLSYNSNLAIQNNDSVLFEKNYSNYRLRSIYAYGSSSTITLSAPAGKSIEFRDSVYIGSGTTVNLNADYTDAEGVVHKQTGDIIFTGKYTEQHLNELLASDGLSRTATESEILYSRTSVVSSVINLYGGRLRVEDGAVLDCAGLIAAAGSGATLRVKDAELSHAGYDITLASGTTLEAEGVNAVAASRLVMQEGSTLRFVLNEDNLSAAALTLDGELSLNGSVSLVLNEGLASGRYSLMTYTGLSGDTSQLRAELPEEYELVWDDSSTDVIVWRQVTLPEEAAEWTENHTYTRAVADTDVIYDSVSLNGGIYEVSGSGSLGVGGILSVTGGADVMVDVDTMALGVEVGDDSRLDLRKSLNLVSVMRLSGDETEYTEAISVGRNAVLLLTDASLLGQVAVADESSELYYQTTAGDKLLKFTGDMGDGGLNLTTDESGTKVYAADSAGFAGNITVLSGATLVNAASSANDGVPFGENYAANANRSITVQKDAVLDINGRETYYRVVLEEGAVLTNGGEDVHESWKGLPVIDLTGDAEVNAAAQICMVGGSYATNYLNLNGHKLSKTGADCLILRKTDISAGTLAVNEGLLYFMGSTSFASGTSVEVNNGGTLWIPETTGSYAGKLTVNAGGRVYLGEGPNGTLDGDLVTDNRSIDLSTLSEVALSGGTLTFRGGSLALGEVAVTADSTLEIWDQGGSSGMVATASTIETLDAGAALNLATTWKSHLNINVLKGAGSLTVGSSREQHRVEVQDMRAYTGSFAVNGSQSTLVLNLAKEYVLSAGRVTKDADSTLLLHGEGAYDIGTEKALAAGVTLAEDWIGSVRLTGATLSGDTLAGLSNAASTVELHGVSGYLSRADAQGGTQTYTANLKLTDNGDTAAWDLNNGYKGDVRVFSGDISGTGTLKRSSYKGTNQTLIFTGDAGGWTGAIDHAPNSGKNSGAVVSTNVTFSGTKELNVEMRTNGKGELNVTLDDEHQAAGSKVKVNGRIGADSLTVTEGTVAQLQNEAAVTRLAVAGAAELGAAGSVQHGEGTQLVSREEADLALLFGVESTETQIIGLHAESALQNISITAGSAYLMQNLALDNVSFSATDAALTLRGVTFSGDCSFSVGESGSILLDAATLTVVLPELAGHEDGVLRLDYSNLFHCVASGQLDIALDTDSLMEEGYHSITFDFGDDVDYSRLSLKLEGASYSGSSAGVAHFSLSVPEPTSTALSLLALAGLAARRRRK